MKPPIYVDHYLQTSILSRLADAERPLRFSELKEDGIENSLFMYHANKLLARGAIEKTEAGFALTATGARWVNAVAADTMRPKPVVKPLVQMIVHDEQSNVLLSTRKGQLKELLNDYSLPAGLHKAGQTATENAQRVARNLFPNLSLTPQFLCVAESINTYADGFVFHALSHVFVAAVPPNVSLAADDRFDFVWQPVSTVTPDNPAYTQSQFVPVFLQKWRGDNLQSHEVIRSHYS